MGDLNFIKRFRIEDDFFGRYENLIKDKVLPYQEKALNDMIEGAEKSHCIENFRMAAQKLETGSCDGEFYGMVFQDSDIAKWLEGAAYSLLMYPDAELEKRCDEVIELIGRAQHEDGYLNTYFTVKEPDKRWTNLCEAHELYCAGHMIEAAVAYAECTGKKRLLEIMCRMADHIYRHFVLEGAPGFSGHPEIELALMRLYRCTGDAKYMKLALHFINARGEDTEYFVKEREKCKWTVWGNNPHDTEYSQSHAPVRKQDKAVGHAVRAVYLYTGMADAAFETGDKQLAAACAKLWDNITGCRMYITGAIGSAYEGEAFTEDYHLPNNSAYGETCAAIGLVFFAGKMLKLEHNGKYADVMERALYNCILAGMELDGTKFFYVNPLEVLPGISGVARSHPHTLPVRPKWFTCACCPPNVARLLPSVAEYAWTVDGNVLYSNLFIGGTLDMGDRFGGNVVLQSGMPYDGRLRYSFEPSVGSMNMTLAVRIPDWSVNTVITKNGGQVFYTVKDGYAYIEGPFYESDIIDVELDMEIRRVYANVNLAADSNMAAIQRGPLVYCAEGVDNDGCVLSLSLRADGDIRAGERMTEVFGVEGESAVTVVKLYADGLRTVKTDALYSYEKLHRSPCTIRLIPYFAWANRGLTQMRVWLPEV